MRQLVNQVCYTRYQVSLYFWWIGSLLKRCKVPKYYDQDCGSIKRSYVLKQTCRGVLQDYYIEYGLLLPSSIKKVKRSYFDIYWCSTVNYIKKSYNHCILWLSLMATISEQCLLHPFNISTSSIRLWKNIDSILLILPPIKHLRVVFLFISTWAYDFH